MKLIHLSCLLGLSVFAHAEAPKFELRDGDRVLLLGDALLERENTLGYLEARMHAAWPQTKFTVRNLSWAGDTPKGWSRASFDGPAKGYERLKEQISLVKPTVVFLGYGMAASLQEMTDRSGDIMLNRDAARYGEEPMSAARFKKELGELMTDIESTGEKPRFVLMSPIKHEDLRKTRPGTVDPTKHNELLAQYSKSIEELATERKTTFVDLFNIVGSFQAQEGKGASLTQDGIHLSDSGNARTAAAIQSVIRSESVKANTWKPEPTIAASILKKNDLFFHRTRPANSTYLFGFRKHEQGRNAVEIPQFAPLVDAVDAEIDSLKRGKASAKEAAKPAEGTATQAPQPIPNFTMEDGYEITLWADTNLVGKPVGMNWDAAGRLWVACSPVYPMIAPGAHPEDKVVVIEDTDHDGKADKSTTFATNLLIAAGVAPDFAEVGGKQPDGSGSAKLPTDNRPLPTPNAAYVGSSTELVHVTDTDGDGKADQRRVVLSGFGTEDTHHTIHTLKWGPDGRLYFNQSIYIHSHLETPYGMVRVNSGAIMAYDPRTERTEVIAKGWCNPWGHVWDEWGQQFTTDGAGGQGISWLVPGAMYFTYENAKRIMPSISPGSYPKFCGLELVRSPLFPAGWQGNAITCDFRAHRIARFSIKDLSPAKSGYETKAEADLVRTTDSAFRPIDVKMGPDGALYVADWTNPVINHGEVDFRDPRRDHVNGRIWRIAPKGSTPIKWESLVGKKVEELAKGALSKNTWESANALWLLRDKQIKASNSGAKESSGWVNYPPLKGIDTRDAQQDEPKDVKTIYDAIKSALLLPETEINNAASELDSITGGGPFPSAKPGQAIYLDTEGNRIDPQKVELTTYYKLKEGLLSGKMMSSPDHRSRAAWVSKVSDTSVGGFEEVAKKLLPRELAKSIRDTNPRVRVEAMRALSRIPTVESAALVLEAAVNGGSAAALPSSPTGQFVNSTAAADSDTHYAYAAWLSVNDLAPQVMEYVEKLAADPATAAKQQAAISFALQALPGDKTGPLLSKIIAKNGVPANGSGPWIELIGQTGGPKELSLIYLGLVAGPSAVSFGEGIVDANLMQFAFKDGTVAARAAAALLQAAARGVKASSPFKDGNMRFEDLSRLIDGPAEPAVARLIGYYKPEGSVTMLARMARPARRGDVSAAAFDALAMVGGADVVKFLDGFFTPAPKDGGDDERIWAYVYADDKTRRGALRALSVVAPAKAISHLSSALASVAQEDALVAEFRALFTSEAFKGKFAAAVPKDLPKPALAAALRASRELGRKGEALTNALTQAVGSDAPATVDMPALVKATALGNPMEGEAIYRRLALACTACHAIGGAGGKVGPELMTIGASAPVDYIVESLFVPNAKVKEGYNAIALTLKGGRAASGVLLRETAEAVFLRDAAGNETSVPKGDITARENVGSIMPAGLINALPDKEKASLFAFLSQLGKPGPFDATKANIARVWWLYPGKDVEALVAGKANGPGAKTLTYVDGRLPKAALTEALQMVPDSGDTVVAVAKFAGAGKTRLNMQGVTKAWLDGAPLAIASNPSPEVELTAGNHTLVVKLDTKQLPENLRAECPEGRFATE